MDRNGVVRCKLHGTSERCKEDDLLIDIQKALNALCGCVYIVIPALVAMLHLPFLEVCG